MATLPQLQVDRDAINLITAFTPNLVNGRTYIAQNNGAREIEYVNAAADPTGQDVGWRVCAPLAFFRFDAETGNEVYVRAPSGPSGLSVGPL